MNNEFVERVKKEYGSSTYEGVNAISAIGTEHSWFDEVDKDKLVIHVDPELSKTQYSEISRLTELASQFYKTLALVFDDWVYLLEYVNCTSPKRAANLHKYAKDGISPQNGNPTFFSWDKYSSPVKAQGSLQMGSTPRYRIAFDASKVAYSIPDEGPICYLNQGPGGGSQAITSQYVPSESVSEVYDMVLQNPI